MRRIQTLVVVAALAFTAAACQNECSGADACAAPRATVTIGSAQNARTFTVEIAATPESRSQGLMNRSELAAAAGMLFMFPEPVRAGFWMKNTLIDLDIAFIGGDRVVEVRRMTPCSEDPCPVTRPAGVYDRALEVRAGTLDLVRPGDPVKIQGILPTPS